MKYLILLVLVQGLHGWRIHHEKYLGFLIKNETYAEAPDQWFTQILDHNNPSDGRTWQQRYYVNNAFQSNNGPVFLFIGGEAELTSYWISHGAWIQYAQQFNALCFAVEHRFYGKSQPTGDLSAESLQYLSSEQALGDLKSFIDGMNVQYGLDANTKWIVFGGSYPGALAAWMRLKFPDSVHGAVASSAPILAKVDFSDYYKVVDNALRIYSDECVSAIGQAIADIGSLIQGGTGGQQILDNKFRLCYPIESFVNNPRYISYLYEVIAEIIGVNVQYNKLSGPGRGIDAVCNTMTNEQYGEPVDRLADVVAANLPHSASCLNYDYNGMIAYLKNTNVNENASARQWIYQSCSEFGFFATSSENPSTFGNSLSVDYFTEKCSEIYGQQFSSDYINSRVSNTNSYYGGLDIDVTNVVFVHGSIDPWHALGLTHTRNPEAPVIYIEGTSHCADMGDDPTQEMQAVRERIAGYIGQWLS